MQIRARCSFLLLIAIVSVGFFSSCSQRRYASRTIKIGGNSGIQWQSSSKIEPVDAALRNVQFKQSSDLDLNEFSEIEIAPEERFHSESKELRTKKKLMFTGRIPSKVELFRNIPLRKVKGYEFITRTENKKNRTSQEPARIMEDALLTAFAVLLLLALFGGIFLLLNHWFLHLSSKQILKGLLALAFGVFIVLLLTLS